MNWNSQRSLIAAIISGIVASLCCVGPLVLLMVGVSGAWISNLLLFTPVRPIAIIVTIFFLGLSFWQLYIKPRSCAPGNSCTKPSNIHFQRLVFWIVTIPLLIFLTIPWISLLFH